MNKTEYIIRQFSKTNKKNFENYVITRIWHLLNNTNIKIVTQQYVKRLTGRALTDLYFPQINLHIEIDEGHHFDDSGKQINEDLIRDADIINATGNEPIRIQVCGEGRYDLDINIINRKIDEVIQIIKSKFNEISYEDWDIDSEYDPSTYIKKGMICADENVSFRTIAAACNCFGNNYVNVQRGFFKHPIEDRYLWFPKLYPNSDWENQLSTDEKVITMKKIHDNDQFIENRLLNKNEENKNRELKERVTFARVRSNLGDIMYRFKGVYQCDIKESIRQGQFVYNRTATQVKTYAPLVVQQTKLGVNQTVGSPIKL